MTRLSKKHLYILTRLGLATMALTGLLAFTHFAWADASKLPGDDVVSKMEAAMTIVKFIDVGLFRWAARLLAGVCLFGAGWNLKEMRFGPAFISIIAAIMFGTAPTWVKNIFSIGNSDSVFSQVNTGTKHTSFHFSPRSSYHQSPQGHQNQEVNPHA
jgi:hypothetical protein